MYELKLKEMSKIANYYKDATDSCIYSVLQGYMGRAFVEDNKNCSMAVLVQGDFVFPSGEDAIFEEEKAIRLLEDLKQFENSKEFLYVPQSKSWHEFLLKQENLKVIKRYTLSKMQLSDFDKTSLNMLVNQLPKDYKFARVNETIYEKLLAQEWSEDNVNNFASVSDFVMRGLGIVILKEDEIVCAASSYTAYDQGIEVEIATKKEYRRQGLATMCGARLILECIQENKIPNWDAANMMSVAIAKKLGYTFLGEYDTFVLK